MFDTLEQEVITSKEDQIMISTATKIFNEGRKEGIKEGIREGIEKSIKEGKEKGRKEIALRMLQQNMELQLISQVTDLSIEQVQKLKNKE